MKNDFIILKDTAVIDLGYEHEGDNRFIIIDGVGVDNSGALSPESLALCKRALSTEAVKQGATRIHQSDCVDITNGGAEASDDMVRAYNAGDRFDGKEVVQLIDLINANPTYTDEEKADAVKYVQHDQDRYDFLVANKVFVPLELFQVKVVGRIKDDAEFTTEIDINAKYKSTVDAVLGVLQFVPFVNKAWILKIINIVIYESKLINFVDADVKAVAQLVEAQR